MNNEIRPKKGAPYGNRNALKHGFYSRALNAYEKEGLPHAASIEGVDEEIALLRLKLRSALLHDPDNFKVIEQALLTLNRLLRTRSKLGNKKGLIEAIQNILRDIAIPLGIGTTPSSHQP